MFGIKRTVAAINNRRDAMSNNMDRSRAGAGLPGMKKGGETKAMMKKEVSFMKKKGAPKSMIKHEEREMKGVKKYARGGGIEAKGKTRGKMVKMAGGGKC